MMDGSAAWRPGAGAQAALQTSNLFQQPQQQPQLGWPPGRVPPPPPDVQQQLAQWYWWTQYASFCQGAAAATATGGPNHFVAGPRALDGAQGYAQGFQHYIPFPAPHLAASASVAPGGDGASGGISKPVAVRAFSSAHVAGISPIPVPSREEPAKKRSEAPARGRKRRTTPENRFCVNCGAQRARSLASSCLWPPQGPVLSRSEPQLTQRYLLAFSPGTTNTPFWRKHKSGGALCNACGALAGSKPGGQISRAAASVKCSRCHSRLAQGSTWRRTTPRGRGCSGRARALTPVRDPPRFAPMTTLVTVG